MLEHMLEADDVDLWSKDERYISSIVELVYSVVEHAEKECRPPGYVDHPTGEICIPYLLALLEEATTAAEVTACLSFLNIDILLRSLFIDQRGEKLFRILTQFSQR